MYMRAIEYVVLDDPSPTPRTYWSYLVASLRDTFLPFDDNGAAVWAAGGSSSGGRPRSLAQAGRLEKQPGQQAVPGRRPASRQVLMRQPLAAPGSSYPVAVGRILLQLLFQYVLYDSLLTLCVKPLYGASPLSPDDAAPSSSPSSSPPPLFSSRSLLASMAFTVCLYLHFALSYKIGMLALYHVWQQLLYSCHHQFAEPWRGLTSVSELWQRWHQLFRMSFVRLAYRPARALVRRLRQPRPRSHGEAQRDGSGASNGAGTVGASGIGSNRRGGARVGGGGAHGVEEAVGLMAVFLMSGIVHEYMCWAAFGSARGWQLAFFLAHGLAVLVEQATTRRGKGGAVPGGGGSSGKRQVTGRWLAAQQRERVAGLVRGAACAAFCAASSVLFMRPWLQAGYHQDFWHPVSPAAWVLRRLGGWPLRQEL